MAKLEMVEEKKARIKSWVNSKLLELDEQSKRLQLQNMLCSRRLELLQRSEVRTAEWKTNLMTYSAEGNRMLTRNQASGTDLLLISTKNRVDEYGNLAEWPDIQEQRRTASVERVRDDRFKDKWDKKSGNLNIIQRFEINSHSLPRNSFYRVNDDFQNGTFFSNIKNNNVELQCDSLPASPRKPIPKPRTKLRRNCNKNLNDSSCFMERDSLEPNANFFESSPEAQTSDWEQRIRDKAELDRQLCQLAQSCFLPSTSSQGKRDTYVPRDPKHKSNLFRSTVDQPITVPIYCVYSGNDRHTKRAADASGSESVRSSKEATSGSSTCHKICNFDDGRSPSIHSYQNKPNHLRNELNAALEELVTSSDEDYAMPPDAGNLVHDLDLKCVAKDGSGYDMTTSVKISGYLNKLGNRTKTWKKRWFVLKEDALRYFRSQNDQDSKQPAGTINVADIISLSRLSGSSSSSDGLEIITSKGKFCLSTENSESGEQWFKSLQVCRKEALAKKAHVNPETSRTCGWLTKVYFGRSKRYWCVLSDSNLLFYKKPSAQLPRTQICLINAKIKETPKSSEDESDNELYYNCSRQYSIEISTPDNNVTYLLFATADEKEKWMYHITLMTSGGTQSASTPFELLIHKLMESDGHPSSIHWSDPIFVSCPEKQTTCLTSVAGESNQKLAKTLYQSIYLFCTVPMKHGATDYHVDLAQNALSSAMTHESLRDELITLLIKFTCKNSASHQQAWRLLALCLSLFSSTRYPVTWLVKKYLHKRLVDDDVKLGLAVLCKRAFDRCIALGSRLEPPSRLEAMSFLTRDPCEHSMPHSIPVHLPDGTYQVIGFDGSSTIEECSENLCQILKMRSVRLSGFAMYAEDPKLSGSMQPLVPKDKLCDVISRWEKSLKEVTAGKVPTQKAIKIVFRQRFYWRHLCIDQTDKETIFQAYDCCQEVKNEHIPVSIDLAVEICSLFCQMHFGSFKSNGLDSKIEFVTKKCLSEKLLVSTCKNTLNQRISDGWMRLSQKQISYQDCASSIVSTLKVWPYFASTIFNATVKWKSEEPVLLAVSDMGVTMLEAHTMDQIRNYPFESIIKFGGLRNDFVMVVYRNLCTENESSQERLVFGMAKLQIYEATLLIADYIKARRGVSLKQTCSLSPKHLAR